jgi:Putative sensor
MTSAFESESGIDFIFGPVVQARTYRNLVYLLVSFPFGIATFVAMITGLSLGVGTAIIFVGFLILALTLALGRVFGLVERRLVESLLGAGFEPRVAVVPGPLPARLTDQRSWLTAMYFLVRFPLAVMGFVASILFLSSILVMAAPLLYTVMPITVGFERVTSSEEALLVSLFGCVLFLLCVHGINGLAAISRRLALAML